MWIRGFRLCSSFSCRSRFMNRKRWKVQSHWHWESIEIFALIGSALMIWARGQQRMAFRYALWSIKVNGRSAPNDMTFQLYRIHLRPQAKSRGRHPSSLFGNATMVSSLLLLTDIMSRTLEKEQKYVSYCFARNSNLIFSFIKTNLLS